MIDPGSTAMTAQSLLPILKYIVIAMFGIPGIVLYLNRR